MSKRRTRREKIKAQIKKPEPPAAEPIEKNLIIKDLLKTSLITVGLLIVLGMLIVFLKP